MSVSQPGFAARLCLALRAFLRILTDGGFAGGVLGLEQGVPTPPVPASEPPKSAPLRAWSKLTVAGLAVFSPAASSSKALNKAVSTACNSCLLPIVIIKPVQPWASGVCR